MCFWMKSQNAQKNSLSNFHNSVLNLTYHERLNGAHVGETRAMPCNNVTETATYFSFFFVAIIVIDVVVYAPPLTFLSGNCSR